MTRWVKRGLLAIVCLFVIGVVGGTLWLRTSLPQTSGTVRLEGITAPVEIMRDRHGIPHIRAAKRADAIFALGYVHAQDRLFQMEFMRRLGAGRLSELAGQATVAIDRRMRIFGLYLRAEQSLSHLSGETLRALEAYAAGVNAYLETHAGVLAPELSLIRAHPEPWRPADSLVWARLMAMRLSSNWYAEALRARLDRRLSPAQVADFWPRDEGKTPPTLDTASTADAEAFAALMSAWPEPIAPITASNSWGIAGDRTESGRPVLANDPHLGFRAPIMWYLARLEWPGGELTGATVPGVPFLILGHNGRIAWAFTTTESDTQDLFIERLDPDDPGRYLTPEGPRPFATRTETIRVRGGADVTITVRETRHGPVVSDLDPRAARLAGDGHVIALAATALLPDDTTADAIWGLDRARDWETFIAALERFHAPQQNITYADVDGNLGFIAPGRVPIRAGGDGLRPVEGWTGAHDWTGFIPYRALPRRLNPRSGRIVNANNPIVGPEYPYRLGHGGSPHYRATRIHQMLDEDEPHSVRRSAEMQLDGLALDARDLLPLMTRITARSDRAAAALALVRDWNGEMDRSRPEPLIYVAWLRELDRLLYADETGDVFPEMWRLRPIFVKAALSRKRDWCDDVGTPVRETCEERLVEALERAVSALAADYGDTPASWSWGKAHYASFRHPLLGWIPVLGALGNIEVASSGGAFTVNRAQHATASSRAPFASIHGPGYRAIYDLADLDRSLFVIATGQSGNPLSPRYADLNPVWSEGRYVRIPGDRKAAQNGSLGTLTMEPSR